MSASTLAYAQAPRLADAQALTKVLGGKWLGTYGMARCPCHDNENPSLQISQNRNGSDVIVKCHAGCDWRIVKDELIREE